MSSPESTPLLFLVHSWARFIISSFHLSSQSISQGATISNLISVCPCNELFVGNSFSYITVTFKMSLWSFSSVSAVFFPGLERMVLNPSSQQCLRDMLRVQEAL